MQTTFKLFSSCFFCLSLALVSGCGSSLTPVERAEVDKIIADQGKNAIVHYLQTTNKDTDEELALKYVKYFASKGADIDVKNYDDVSPLCLAVRLGHIKVVQFLMSKGADIKGDVMGSAVRAGNIEMTKLLLAKGGAYALPWKDIYTAVVRNKDLEMTKLLLSSEENLKNWVLDVTVQSNNIELTEMALYQGADVNSKGGNFTLLTTAVRSTGHDGIEMVQFLVEKGADVNVKVSDFEGGGMKTALDVAKKQGYTAVVEYLESVGAKSAKDL